MSQPFTRYFDTFSTFSRVTYHNKLNATRLLSPKPECNITSQGASGVKSYDLLLVKKSKLDAEIQSSLVLSLHSSNKNLPKVLSSCNKISFSTFRRKH